MDQHAGVGDEVHDGLEHVLSDGELPLGCSQGVSQRTDNVGETWQKTTIKICHAEQPLHVQLGRGQRELLDGYLLNHVTKEGNCRLVEDALLHVHRQIVLSKAGEDLPKMVLVVLQMQGGTAYQASSMYIKINDKSQSTSCITH